MAYGGIVDGTAETYLNLKPRRTKDADVSRVAVGTVSIIAFPISYIYSFLLTALRQQRYESLHFLLCIIFLFTNAQYLTFAIVVIVERNLW